MRHGSLFSGIGGFDVASKWMGWQNIFSVEIDPFCGKILNKHFPDTAHFTDIKEFNGKRYKNKIDIITGGFPCQPFSLTGTQKGKDDDRYLFPEMLRVIKEIKPTWVVGENVAAILTSAADEICLALAAAGYKTDVYLRPFGKIEGRSGFPARLSSWKA